MANYSFKETVHVFSEKLKTAPPETDIENGEAELVIDAFHVVLTEGKIEGSLHMKIALGLLLHPVREEKLKELATANFLGINTGGCKLSFDASGISLSLHCYTTSATNPQESWEWLHRLLSVAREWNKILIHWDEFVPLSLQFEEKKNDHKSDSTLRV